VSRRSRIFGFGSAALLVLAGAVCTVVLSGIASDLALGVLGVGVAVAISLLFLEVGLSEDRERAREEASKRRKDAARQPHDSGRGRRSRLERIRGRPRRLR
jgi:hypothetical protein